MIESPSYRLDALEPYISEKSMDVHFNKLHKGYANKLLKITKGTLFEDMDLLEIIKKTSWVHGPESFKVIKSNDGLHQFKRDLNIYNNAAQIWNHNFYWKCLSPDGGGTPGKKIMQQIDKDFGSFDDFKKEFVKVAMGHFGSGWLWVVFDKKIKIHSYSNAITPASFEYPDELSILLTLDLFEHAYFIDFLNRRAEFVDIFLKNLINWDFVENRFIKID